MGRSNNSKPTSLLSPISTRNVKKKGVLEKSGRKRELSETAEMEEDETQSRAGGGVATHWWWAAGSAAQLGWGVASFRKGHGGSANMMPLKAFAVASLFVGAAASATVAAIRASGIHKVEDMVEVGANIRTALGARPRARDE